MVGTVARREVTNEITSLTVCSLLKTVKRICLFGQFG